MADEKIIDCSQISQVYDCPRVHHLPHRRATRTYVAYPTTPASTIGMTRAVHLLTTIRFRSAGVSIFANPWVLVSERAAISFLIAGLRVGQQNKLSSRAAVAAEMLRLALSIASVLLNYIHDESNEWQAEYSLCNGNVKLVKSRADDARLSA